MVTSRKYYEHKLQKVLHMKCKKKKRKKVQKKENKHKQISYF